MRPAEIGGSGILADLDDAAGASATIRIAEA
jgi:hypothetical protein